MYVSNGVIRRKSVLCLCAHVCFLMAAHLVVLCDKIYTVVCNPMQVLLWVRDVRA